MSKLNKPELRIDKGQHRTLSVLVKPNASLLRVETVRNHEYAVTPAVILVEGILQGALADVPELALASEFGKIPDAWNGRPVVVNHPRRNDSFVSAGIPDVFAQEVIGWIFNARIEDSKLKCELWTNKTWMEESGYNDIKENVENSTTMEVSTGLFADIEQVSGVWNGEQYSGIWRNIVPDHLAILTNSPGACSVADGCGTSRTNQQILNYGSSPEELNKTQEQSMCKKAEVNQQTQNPGVFQRLMSFMSSVKPQTAEMSTGDLSNAVQAALASVEKNYYLVAVYDDRVVYETYKDEGGWIVMQRDFSVDATGVITIGSAAIQVRPKTDFVPVNVIVNELTAKETPDANAEAQKIAGTEGTEGTEGTAAAAAGTGGAGETIPAEEVKTESASVTGVVEPKEVVTPAINSTPDNKEGVITLPEGKISVVLQNSAPITLDTFLKNGTSEDVVRVNEALAVLAQRRKELIDSIISTPKNAFTPNELSVMKVNQLEKIAAFAQKVDYSGNASPQVHSGNADIEGNSPPKAFPCLVASK